MSIMDGPNIVWDEPATFDDLTAEQQDQLFYALIEARLAVRSFYLDEFGTGVPLGFEQALAHAYADHANSDELGPLP